MTKHTHLTLVPLALLTAAFFAGCGAAEKPASAPADVAPAKEVAKPAAPTAAAKPAAGTPGDAEAGKAVYMRVCFACHQPTGLGLPGAFPPLAGSSIVTEADPGKIIRIVLHGLQGPIEVKGVKYNSMMPPHGPQLKDKEIADVLTYVRNTWENKATAVTVEAVAEVRAKDAARTTPWTWAELTK
jgi:mono/diheme cytochrome c family protein